MSEDRHSGVPGGNGSGADVKSGKISNEPDGATGVVTFTTAFASIPNVTATLIQAIGYGAVDVLIIGAVTATGFEWEIHKGHGGSGHNWGFHWIATDAGNP